MKREKFLEITSYIGEITKGSEFEGFDEYDMKIDNPNF